MGKKSKSSRKGKKAWRANISTEDIEEYFEKSTKDALSGGPLTDVPSDSLFYVDKSRDLSAKRKIEKCRDKVLWYESVLQRNTFVQPVPASKQKKVKGNDKMIPAAKGPKTEDCQKDAGSADTGMVDIWNDQGEHGTKTKKKSKLSIIPAVEIEPAGCSFNPSFESHQDSLARAVADEMQKIYQNELGPEPVPLVVPGEEVDEEEMYFLDADNGSDEDDPNESPNADTEIDLEKRPLTTKRVTRVEHNRRARRREQLRAEVETKNVHELSKEIDSIQDIIQEIARDDEKKEKRHLRRTIARKERLKSRPPRLGKHKFQPAPLQVLLSEEISGSLRKLKGCCVLAKDRFKSLEKRGLIVPTAKGRRNK